MRPNFETVTPAKAKIYLQNMAKNRPVSKSKLKRYISDIEEGRWNEWCGSIEFRKADGKTMNGQHRLLAIIATGKSMNLLLVHGVPDDAFATMDTGKRRNGSDTLSVSGYKNTNLTAAAIAMVERYRTGKMEHVITFTNQEILDLAKKYNDIAPSVTYAASHKVRWLRASVVAAFHYLFSKRDPDAADAFFNKLISGQGLSNGDPAYILRERLIENMTAPIRLTEPAVRALLIKAWNAHYQGRRLRTLSQKRTDAFPEIV